MSGNSRRRTTTVQRRRPSKGSDFQRQLAFHYILCKKALCGWPAKVRVQRTEDKVIGSQGHKTQPDCRRVFGRLTRTSGGYAAPLAPEQRLVEYQIPRLTAGVAEQFCHVAA
ncbi:hypothetical protein COEREDRAFT_80199 [Coemansia reversa NRRL 1564]|uniref:Uncharacterized protein n=1 Tax=Coemansia reversa (strain ATCC 12441 / NRRL 1564) TaxID=763665 RepID=A0A2G5BFU6_COERN|nr:hypothetical protein COEREDRAFT_80199 [Coemansia reversa NRRL 1564]|eukprot:PIA17873.1 hypothetical protein COEREDRAFT_80199 [Coemansia reversa NRRL 1564]